METFIDCENFRLYFTYRGDTTQATISNLDDYFVEGFGQVTRHPNDKPNRTLGDKFALTAALENSNLDRFERSRIWHIFWEYNTI